jgi:hypothetical protein
VGVRRLGALVGVILLAGCGGSSSPNTTGAPSAAVRLGPPFPDIAKLPGAQRDGPPWSSGWDQLQLRLRVIGLPALSAEGQVVHIHQHLDIYVRGHHETVPANIGIDPGGHFISPLDTHDTKGIIHVESPTASEFGLGQFFAVWGVALSATRLGGLRAGGSEQLRTWVNGRPVNADPTRIVLASHQEIALAYGTAAQMPKRPAASYAFPPGY